MRREMLKIKSKKGLNDTLLGRSVILIVGIMLVCCITYMLF